MEGDDGEAHRRPVKSQTHIISVNNPLQIIHITKLYHHVIVRAGIKVFLVRNMLHEQKFHKKIYLVVGRFTNLSEIMSKSLWCLLQFC